MNIFSVQILALTPDEEKADAIQQKPNITPYEAYRRGHRDARSSVLEIADKADRELSLCYQDIHQMRKFLVSLTTRLGEGQLEDGFGDDSRYKWVRRGQELLDRTTPNRKAEESETV